MNKTLIFVAGLLTGAAAGTTATYFLLHDRLVAEAQDEIEHYAEHCEERIASIRAKYAGKQPETDDLEEEVEEDPDNRDEALIRRNEGVKRYHHESEYMGNDYGASSIFAKTEEKKVTELEKEVKEVGDKDDPMIEEIDEETYLLTEDEYSKEIIDFVYPDEKGYWGYGTDNEITVNQKFGRGMLELIGQPARWLMDYVKEDEGTGVAYFRNKHLMTDFEVIIHDNES